MAAYFANTPRVVARRGRPPVGEPARELVRRDLEVERPASRRRARSVAVADGRDRAAARRLRRDVADHQAVRRAREAAVGDQRDLVAEPLADERGGDVQHLAHAGAAGRALVADHDHVARLDRARLDGREARLLGVEDARRAAVEQPLVPGELDHAALGRERAAQDREPAGRLDRRLPRHDDVLARPSRRRPPRPRRASVRRRRGRPRAPAGADELAGDQPDAAGLVHVGGDIAAAGLEVGDDRRLPGDRVEVLELERRGRARGRSRAGGARRSSSRRSRRPRRSRSRTPRGSGSATGGCPRGRAPSRARPPRAPPPPSSDARRGCRRGRAG